MGHSSTLVIIPTFNEEESIGTLLNHLAAIQMSNSISQFEVLVVDDNSPDKTIEIIKSFDYEWVNLEVRPKKDGLGNAYKFGFNWAFQHGYDYAIEMDADGSHQVDDLVKLLKAEEKIDLVIGSRWVPEGKIVNWPIYRRLISRLGNVYAKKMLGIKINDSTSGFRRLRISKLSRINLDSITSKGYGFQIEITFAFWKNGFLIQEVPISFLEREFGESKMTLGIAAETFWNVTLLSLTRRFR
jgi:dolichol-phosphate mannosyltransferase